MSQDSILHNFILYIGIIFLIMFLVMLANKIKVAYPIVLVIGGLLVSLVPGLPEITIDPEMIFVVFLPPLLFEAAWYTSWKELWKWRRVVGSFAFLIVIVTSFVVAVVSSQLIPGFTLALGFLLGGIISPPDAVSATSVLKYVKIPKRLSSIIEGESLLNDASSLIIFRFALITVTTGRFVFRDAALNFFVVIFLGILVGILIGYIFYMIHRWTPTTTNIDIVLTLTAPYVMYIVAEHFKASGVLAVVSGGLFLSTRNYLFLSHRSRLSGSNVWSTLGFVLNGLVFMLIGLELPYITKNLESEGIATAIWYGVLITALLMVTRIICTMTASVFTVFISRYISTADSNPGWKGPLIFGWAGMRGVVSLAAALSIPVYSSHGVPFPHRNLILFITFVVILLTLVVQGLTLPVLIKWVNMEDPDKKQPLAKNEEIIRKKIADKSLKYLEEKYSDRLKSNSSLQQLLVKIANDQSSDEDGIREKDFFADVYLDLLEQQRTWLAGIDKASDVDDEIIRRHQAIIDLEEEKMFVRFKNADLR